MSAKTMTINEWIIKIGVNEVAGLLRADRSNVRLWIRGCVLPKGELMYKILVYSKGVVDLNQSVIEHYSPSNKNRWIKK